PASPGWNSRGSCATASASARCASSHSPATARRRTRLPRARPDSTTTWSSRPTSTNCSGNWSWRASPGRWPRRPESALWAGACGRARFALGLADLPSKGTAMRPSRTIVSLLQLALVIAVPGTLVACGGERASDTDAEATMEDAAPMDDGAAMDQDAGADDGIGAGA